MTPEQISLIQTSFNRVAPLGDRLMDSFYTRLFELAPQVRAMFPKDTSKQKEKLLQMLAYAVNGLNYPEALMPILRELGDRHRGYKAAPEHYSAVSLALMDALKETTPGDFDDATQDAWIACYQLIAGTMEPRLNA